MAVHRLRDGRVATTRTAPSSASWAAGAEVVPTGRVAPCCGALPDHAGLEDQARHLAGQVLAALDDGRPVVVDSAGCGAMLKEYGELWGTPEAARSRRGSSTCTSGWPHLARLPITHSGERVAIQDPCHLRHAQRTHESVRTVLEPVADVVELDDEGLCCGAGGAYSAVQPELAGAIRDRKLEAIQRSGAELVASANPGYALHLAAAGLTVAHLGASGPGVVRSRPWRVSSTRSAVAWKASPRSWPTSPSNGSGSPSTPAATRLPIDERRLTRARRAVEKAIALLQEPDETP